MYQVSSDIPSQNKSIPNVDIICRSLFQNGFILNVNEEGRILNVLCVQPFSILAQQRFTKNEWALLMVLLKSYPHYAPHEVLLSHVTSLTVDECRKRLQETQLLGVGAIKKELKPIYRALSGIRVKLTKLHPSLKVFFIRDTGYIITTSSQGDKDSQNTI